MPFSIIPQLLSNYVGPYNTITCLCLKALPSTEKRPGQDSSNLSHVSGLQLGPPGEVLRILLRRLQQVF